MKRKGFTLIELLAVIMILAIIAIIATPMIIHIIEKARKASFLSSAYGILESAENYYVSTLINEEKVNTITFPDNQELSFKGEKPKNGYIQINEKGKIELQLYNGTWCAYKSYYTSTIHLEDGACQNFKGSITVEESEVTYFRGEIIDPYSGVISYNNENQVTENNIGYYGKLDRRKAGEYKITYYLKDDESVQAEKTFHILEERYHADFDYTGEVQKFEAPYEGVYAIELWGASGGIVTSDAESGAGGYTKGSIHLKKGDTMYVYVGEKGSNNRTATFNGGGYGGYGTKNGYGNSGGGATDIRLINGNWNDIEGLKSRIMVAGGGGGVAAGSYNSAGEKSYAGGLTGYSGGYYSGHSFVNQNGKGGTQIAGGAKGNNHSNGTGTAYSGSFGTGGNNDTTSSSYGAGGGGGGYYGGGAGGSTGYGGAGQGGGGGSSFISGYAGCNAIDKDGNPTSQPNHYSGLIFHDKLMLSGKEEMPNPREDTSMIGNHENGFVRIQFIHY